jgi:hypothetical protein
MKLLNSRHGHFEKNTVSFTEYKKFTSTNMMEVFFHTSKTNIIARLDDIAAIKKYPSTFPQEIYVFSTEQDQKHPNKRFYVLFPTEKVVNTYTKKTQMIADHLTFLINSSNRNDATPVKSHMSIYTPFPTIVVDATNGSRQQINFNLPDEFVLDDVVNGDTFLRKLVPAYRDFVVDVLSKPVQSGGTTHKKASRGKTFRKTLGTTRKRTFVSARLQILLDRFFIEAMIVFRIEDDYTVFIECDIPETEETSSQSSDRVFMATSFTFVSSLHTRREQEKKIVEIMNEWE